MKKKNLLLSAAVTGLVLGANVDSAMASGNNKDTEKCKGVAAKGANSCGANGHGCGGFAKNDFDKNEWVYVKKGTCKKLQAALKDKDLQDFIKKTTTNSRKYKDNFKG